MKAKTIKQTLNEIGSGYAVWGGGSRGGFGNPSHGGIAGGRGFGFGSANNSGGPNMMYTYSIVPLNKTLEPPASDVMDVPVIHTGSVIKGTVLGGKDEHVIGQVLRTEKDEEGNIKYYLVLDPETSTKKKLDPTSSYIWEPEPEGNTPVGYEFIDPRGEEDLVESLHNFERTGDSKRSLNVGHEAKIHNFLRWIADDYQFDPEDPDYHGFLNIRDTI